jgi:hypothetical protein
LHNAFIVYDRYCAAGCLKDRNNVRLVELIGMQRRGRQPVVSVYADLLGLFEHATLNMCQKLSFLAILKSLAYAFDKVVCQDCLGVKIAKFLDSK